MKLEKLKEELSKKKIVISDNILNSVWPRQKNGDFAAPNSTETDEEEGDTNIGGGTVGTPKPPVKP